MSVRLRFALVLVLAASAALAQGKGRGGGGGGGGDPPADPAIAFIEGDLKVMDNDGANATTVLRAGRSETVRGPSWSPDNTRVAVGATLGGSFGVHVVAADGSGSYLAAAMTYDLLYPFPDWSPVPTPDGQEKIVFDAPGATTSDRDIWIVNPDGTGLVNLTSTPNTFESYATFSRDGTRVVFVRDLVQLVVAQLGVVDGEVAITSEFVTYTAVFPQTLAFPEWARTQDLIAVSEKRSQLMRIVILDVFGMPGVPVVLTPSSSGDERWASFSPDDSRIVFHRNGTNGGIFTIGIDGTGETRIASWKGYDPAWRR